MSEHLQEVARQVRNTTLRHLEASPDSWLRWSPDGTSNHILWHAGHAVWLGDVLCIATLEPDRCNLPEGWAETFGMHCRPVATTTEWPPPGEIAVLLRRQLDVMLELLDAHRDRLAEEALLAGRVIHGFHDEAIHCGEMYLLMKLCKANQI